MRVAKLKLLEGRVVAGNVTVAVLLMVLVSCLPSAFSQEVPKAEDEDAEAQYLTVPASDPVARLQKKIEDGSLRLEYHDRHGYLRAVLRELNISPASQTLVFSKTSLQINDIGPRTPRAVYFNDNTYVGWVQGGHMLEIASVDPVQGPVFYIVRQRKDIAPKFARRNVECLGCHSTSRGRGTPGLVVRSLFVRGDGDPDFGSGGYLTTPESPFEQRWGGWYVTGSHGNQRHMGNEIARGGDGNVTLDRERGANVTDLRGRFYTEPYLTPHSDLVALMVMEHQTHLHNRLTQASFLTRDALRDERRMNRFEGLPEHKPREATISRIKSACEPLVQALLFSGETALTDPVSGTSGFAHEFPKQGPRDKKNRSLRDFDLSRRLFRYPCSYLIYSNAFDALPSRAKSYVYERLRAILSGEDKSPEFIHLSADDRSEIREILTDTKPELAAGRIQ